MNPARFCLLLAFNALLYSSTCSAQSPAASSATVSVQELAIPRKAVRAFDRGSALLQQGDAQGSLSFFQAAAALAPNCYQPYHNLGLAYYRLGQLDEAAQNFQRSIDLSKGSFAPSLFGLAMILYSRSEFRQAEALIEQGLLCAPGSAIGQYCLGLVQFSLGRTADARRSALDALRLDPAEIDAHLLLAHVHERLHDPHAVLAEVDAYLKLAPRGELQSDALGLRQRAQQDLARLAASVN